MDALIAAYQKRHPDDARGWYYQGQWQAEREDFAAAEKAYRVAIGKKSDEQTLGAVKSGWAYARTLNGDPVGAYREVRPDREGFHDIAETCSDKSNAKGLAALVDAHRAADPTDPLLPLWEGEAAYLSGDYEKAFGLFKAHQAAAVQDDDREYWMIYERLSRSAAKTGRREDALTAAKAGIEEEWLDQGAIVVVHLLSNDPAAAVAAARVALEAKDELQWIYEDEDLRELLKSDAFAEFRALVPPQK